MRRHPQVAEPDRRRRRIGAFRNHEEDFLNTGGMKVRYDGELSVGAQSLRQSLVPEPEGELEQPDAHDP
jgi:hypothetical protein